MARLARLSLGGYPHLVMQRVAARPLFATDDEAQCLDRIVRDALSTAVVALHGYALLPEGLWLLATPDDAHGLGRAMQSIGRRYVRWYNDRRGERGGLFEGRYRAAVIEPGPEVLLALRRVELAPVLAELVTVPEAYRWSSCRHHTGLQQDPQLRVHPVVWGLGNTPFERQAAYRAALGDELPRAEIERLDRMLAGGWVLGSPDFVRRIAPLCARRPARARPGRPRRKAAAARPRP
jgi:putative transposase